MRVIALEEGKQKAVNSEGLKEYLNFDFLYKNYNGYNLNDLRGLDDNVLTQIQTFLCKEKGKLGIWQLDEDDFESEENGGTVIVTNTGKRIKRVITDSVYPEWFGAIGDGLNNDTDALRQSIDYCIENNKTLILSGRYFIDDSININRDNLTIKGQNDNLILGPIFWGLKISSSNIQISNVNFKSTIVADYSSLSENGAPQGIANGGLIHVLPPNGQTISNIRIKECSFSSPDGSVNAIKLIAFRSGTGGILRDVFIDKCVFFDCGRMGVEVLGGSGNLFYYYNINVRDCEFYRLGLKSIYGMAVSFSGGGAYNIVSNCYIEGAKDLGLENAGASFTKFVDNKFRLFSPNSTILSIQSNDDHLVKFGNSAVNNKILDNSAYKLADVYYQSNLLFWGNNFSSTHMGTVIQAIQDSTFRDNKLHCDGLSEIVGYGSTMYFREAASLDNLIDSNFMSNSSTAFDIVYISETSGNNKFNANKLVFLNQSSSKELICDKNKTNVIKFLTGNEYARDFNGLGKFKIGNINFFFDADNELLLNVNNPSSQSDGRRIITNGLQYKTTQISGLYCFVNGNVSIGTSVDFGYKVNVSGNARVTADVTIGSNKRLVVDPNYNTGSEIAFRTLDGASIGFYNSTTLLMYLSTNNNIGFGTNSPSEKVDVNGNIKARGKIVLGVGANQAIDSVTLTSGTATKANSLVTASSKILAIHRSVSGAKGVLDAQAGNGTFTINSSSNTDNSTIDVFIFN